MNSMSVWLHRSRIVVTVGERSTGAYDADYAFKLLACVASDPAFTRFEADGEIEYCRDCDTCLPVEPEPYDYHDHYEWFISNR